MNIEDFRFFCLSHPHVEECFPFDEETLVFKVGGKMFSLASLETKPLRITLKCTPEKAIELRESYDNIIPAYHMNKTNWNTLILDGRLSEKLIIELIDFSYNLVLRGLTKSQRQKLNL